MREQPHWTDILTTDFFTKHYVSERMSYPKLRELPLQDGYNISIGTIHKYANKLGFGRNASEAKRNIDPNPLDWSVSYLDERTIEAIDGFQLGDGHIDGKSGIEARIKWTGEHKEFGEYLLMPFNRYMVKLVETNSPKSPSGKIWDGHTKSHPDLTNQHQRWYNSRKKQPPDDVRITPLSVMLWYLGDGSVVINDEKNTIMLRLSTDGFAPERVEFLSEKLREKGIDCHRNNDNRIQVEAKGIAKFFEFIGKKSPVKCYDYKFELPEWRFEAKRMRQVANELGFDYSRLAYWVKTGKVDCLRLSANSKPYFLPVHIKEIRKLIAP